MDSILCENDSRYMSSRLGWLVLRRAQVLRRRMWCVPSFSLFLPLRPWPFVRRDTDTSASGTSRTLKHTSTRCYRFTRRMPISFQSRSEVILDSSLLSIRLVLRRSSFSSIHVSSHSNERLTRKVACSHRLVASLSIETKLVSRRTRVLNCLPSTLMLCSRRATKRAKMPI